MDHHRGGGPKWEGVPLCDDLQETNTHPPCASSLTRRRRRAYLVLFEGPLLLHMWTVFPSHNCFDVGHGHFRGKKADGDGEKLLTAAPSF